MTSEPMTFGGYALGDKLRDEPFGATYAAADAQGRAFEVHLLGREHEADAEVAALAARRRTGAARGESPHRPRARRRPRARPHLLRERSRG